MKKLSVATVIVLSVMALTGCRTFVESFTDAMREDATESFGGAPLVTIYELEVEEYDEGIYCLMGAGKYAEEDGLRIDIDSIELYQDYEFDDGTTANFVDLNVTIENTGGEIIYYYFYYNTYVLLNTGELAAVDYSASTDFQTVFKPGESATGTISFQTICTDIDQLEYIKIQLDGVRDEEGYAISDDNLLYWFTFELPGSEDAESYDYLQRGKEFLSFYYCDYDTSLWSAYPDTHAVQGPLDISFPSVTVMDGYIDDYGNERSVMLMTFVVEFDADERWYFDMDTARITLDGENFIESDYELSYTPIYIVEGEGFYFGYAVFDVVQLQDKYFDHVTFIAESPYKAGDDPEPAAFLTVEIDLDYSAQSPYQVSGIKYQP